MANFEFGKKIIKLEICNKIYSIEDDRNLADKLDRFSKTMKEKANNISENDAYEYYVKVSTDICDCFYKFMDSLFGENFSKEIFKDRMYDVEDCFSLSNFIREEIEKQRSQRISKYSTSRIQRDQRKQNFKKRR